VEMTLGANLLLSRPLILDFKRLWLGYASSPVREDLASYAMESAAGLPLIELRIGERRLWTLLDTGAAYSLLNAAHEAELGLELEEVYRLEGQDPTGQRSWIPVHELDGVRLGEVALGKMEIVRVDLGIIEERLGRRVDFVLGANALIRSGLVWVLDREEARVYVSERTVEVCGQEGNA